jgi:hypothetical protein
MMPQDVHALLDPRDALSPTHGLDDPTFERRAGVVKALRPAQRFGA